MIALKCPFRQVAIDVDGTYGIICTRHVNGNNCFASGIYGLNIVIMQKIYINFLLVIDNIPQVLTNLVSIVNSDYLKSFGFIRLVHVLHHTQQYCSAVCVGESRIGLPKRSR